MKKDLLKTFWWAIFIGFLAGLYVVIYLFVPVSEPLIWAGFASLPVTFMLGCNPKEIPGLSINAIWGIFGAWCCIQLSILFTPFIGPDFAFGAGALVTVFVTVFLFMGILGNTWLDRCAMGFSGFFVCFAANGENLIVAGITMVVGILLGVVMGYAGKLAAKLAGIEEKKGDIENTAS